MSPPLDLILYVALPYVATFTFLLVSVRRYVIRPFTYSSLSSQFLEPQSHFWALAPFHYGIIVVLSAHFLAFLIPSAFLSWNAAPLRLYALEVTGLALGLLTVIGFAAAIARRLTLPKMWVVTSRLDWILNILLMTQIITGVAVAVVHPWGSSWFAIAMSPYLWSLATFRPDMSFVTGMPWLVKAHIINAFLLLWIFPFSRLAHILVAPFPYLWRRPQVVRWHSATVAK